MSMYSCFEWILAVICVCGQFGRVILGIYPKCFLSLQSSRMILGICLQLFVCQHLQLSRVILLHVQLSRVILVYAQLSRVILVYVQLSWLILGICLKCFWNICSSPEWFLSVHSCLGRFFAFVSSFLSVGSCLEWFFSMHSCLEWFLSMHSLSGLILGICLKYFWNVCSSLERLFVYAQLSR